MGATHARLPLAAAFLVAISVSLVAACNRDGGQVSLDGAADAAPPWDVAQGEPEPRPGMAWIPPGVLIAGTPPDRLPRVADEEMAGEQVVMRGYYIDIFPYPNEIGAIPTTNISARSSRSSGRARGLRTRRTSMATPTRRASA